MKMNIDEIFHHAHIGIIICDAKGRIKRINPFACKMFQYEESELINQKMEILLPKTIRSKHVGYREHYVSSPSPRAMGEGRDLYAVRKNAQQFPVEVSLSSYIDEDQRFVVGFIGDISLRKDSEEKLRNLTYNLEKKVSERTKELSDAMLVLKQNEQKITKALKKEKDLNEMKSRFVSLASHEFRTPLAQIIGSINLIDKYIQAQKPQATTKHIQSIKKSVQGLTSLLNEFLSLDKIEQGAIKANPEFFNLKDLILSLKNDLAKVFPDIVKRLHINYSSKLNQYQVNLDKAMLENILTNLISNALKYSEKDVQLNINFNQNLEISVRDEGLGIPKEEQQYLFNQFFRAQNTKGISGTGLGLTIVKKYLELMKGTITLKSEQNKGSEFNIQLPINLSDGKDNA